MDIHYQTVYMTLKNDLQIKWKNTCHDKTLPNCVCDIKKDFQVKSDKNFVKRKHTIK